MRRRALQGVIDRLRAVRRGSRSRIFVRAARTQRPMLTEMDLDSDRYPGTQSAAHQSPEPLQVDEPARSDDRRGHINSTLRAGVVVRPRYRLRSNRSSVRCFALKLASVRAARFIGGFACVTRRVGITIAGQLRTGGNSRFSTAAGFANHLFPPTSRMRRESHVRFCERLGVKLPGAPGEADGNLQMKVLPDKDRSGSVGIESLSSCGDVRI
jgi:hypothetical protein